MNTKSPSARICVALALCATLFALSPGRARAQFPGMDAINPMGMMRDTQSGALNLLSLPDVQKELKMDKSQTEGVKKMIKERETLAKGMGKGGATDATNAIARIQKMRSDMTALDTRAKALLTDPQRARLSEIRVQVLGTQAVADAEIQSALGLAPEQRSALSALGNEGMMAKMEAMRDYKTTKRKLEGIDKAFGDKAAKILTAEQSARLAAMAGAPFKNVDRIKIF